MRIPAALAALALAAAAQPLSAATPITGRWVTDAKDAVVEIAPCGSEICGRIVQFLTPPKGGPDPRDVNNPDPAKRTRRIMGLPFLSGFTADEAQWNGQIYDPRSGKTYRSVLIRDGNILKVKGCISVFCKTQVWVRAK